MHDIETMCPEKGSFKIKPQAKKKTSFQASDVERTVGYNLKTKCALTVHLNKLNAVIRSNALVAFHANLLS